MFRLFCSRCQNFQWRLCKRGSMKTMSVCELLELMLIGGGIALLIIAKIELSRLAP